MVLQSMNWSWIAAHRLDRRRLDRRRLDRRRLDRRLHNLLEEALFRAPTFPHVQHKDQQLSLIHI